MPANAFFAKIYQGLRSFWWDIVHFDLFRLASAMAYTTLLSIVPSLAVIFSLITVFYPVSGEQSKVLTWIQHKIFEHLATGSGDAVFTYLTSFISQINFAKIGVTGFASLLVTLILLVRQVENALNVIFGAKQERNFLTRLIYFWTLTTLGGLVLSLGITILTKLAKSIGLSEGAGFSFEAFKAWAPVISLMINFSIFFLLYKILPNCEVKYREAISGAAFASFAIYFTSKFYGQNISSLTAYQSLYGALAALPLFLLWLYISWVIALLGALVARKSSQGFLGKSPQLALNDVILKTGGHKDYALNRIAVLSPFVVLILIYRLTQEKQGIIAASDVFQSIKLPRKYIEEALTALLHAGFIHVVKSDFGMKKNKKKSENDEIFYFYNHPSEAMTIDILAQQLAIPSVHEMERFFKDLTGARIVEDLKNMINGKPLNFIPRTSMGKT